jgi:hypothetical protein
MSVGWFILAHSNIGDQLMHISDTLAAFLRGFASTGHVTLEDADSHWASFSYQLSDEERASIEAGGFESGADCGTQYNAAYQQIVADYAD